MKTNPPNHFQLNLGGRKERPIYQKVNNNMPLKVYFSLSCYSIDIRELPPKNEVTQLEYLFLHQVLSDESTDLHR
jgi:hypothetical protein